MRKRAFTRCVVVCGILALSLSSLSAGEKSGLKEGTPKLQSAGSLAFGPNGILFIADPQAAAIFAIDTGDAEGTSSNINVDAIGEKIAAKLGTSPREILVNDLAVNPASGKAYLSVSRGRGPDALPVLLRVDAAGGVSEFSLKNVKFAKADLPNAPGADAKDRRGRSLRGQSITDINFVDGRVFVAGLSNEEFASNLRSIPFPFEKTDGGTSVKIFHGAHGRFETASPVRTFTSYNINGESHLLAAYTCTPLVKFPVSSLKPGANVQGTTVAELGNRNNPLDMVVYKKNGQDYLLIANTSRGLMKVTTSKIATIEGITEKISDTAGLTYEKIGNLEGVVQLDRLNDENAIVLMQSEAGDLNLRTVALP